jgi:hypothetical protein
LNRSELKDSIEYAIKKYLQDEYKMAQTKRRRTYLATIVAKCRALRKA